VGTRYLLLAVILAVLVAALRTPAGGWVQSFFIGSGIRWTDAYEAMGAAESGVPANPRDRDRLVLANARVEGEPPLGMPIDRRIHETGTLARLRYEVIADGGEPLNTIEVRALVPPLPYFAGDARGGEFGEMECPRACYEQLARDDAVRLERSGKAGIAEEWVLRMPVGRTYDLGPRSLSVQDFEDDKPHSIPYSRIRVTLLEACRARVRIGAVTNLEFFPDAVIPIPRELRTRRWVQLEGCPALTKAALVAPKSMAQVADGRSVQAPRLLPLDAYLSSGLEAIKPVRSAPLGFASLVVDEHWVEEHGHSMLFRMLRACRYDPSANRWSPIPFPTGDYAIALRNKRPGEARQPVRVAVRLPQEAGLYWAEWSETEGETPGKSAVHGLLIPTGPVLVCNDANLPEPAAGEIATCVPRARSAEARVVPAPEDHCTP
jgi:hypothetical protein